MQAGFEPGTFRSRGGRLTSRTTRRSGREGEEEEEGGNGRLLGAFAEIKLGSVTKTLPIVAVVVVVVVVVVVIVVAAVA